VVVRTLPKLETSKKPVDN